jgi:hypothetical protein
VLALAAVGVWILRESLGSRSTGSGAERIRVPANQDAAGGMIRRKAAPGGYGKAVCVRS